MNRIVDFISFVVSLVAEWFKTEDKKEMGKEIGKRALGYGLIDGLIAFWVIGIKVTLMHVIKFAIVVLALSTIFTVLMRFREWIKGEPIEPEMVLA